MSAWKRINKSDRKRRAGRRFNIVAFSAPFIQQISLDISGALYSSASMWRTSDYTALVDHMNGKYRYVRKHKIVTL